MKTALTGSLENRQSVILIWKAAKDDPYLISWNSLQGLNGACRALRRSQYP